MNKETRITKIKEEIKLQDEIANRQQQPQLVTEIWWEEKLMPMMVYKIPLKYLVYNKYNGRILSRTKSIERGGIEIKPDTEEGKKCLEDLLWKSKPARNRQTKDSIKRTGQEKVGIVTRDGIIIDGNRRAMLLNKLTEEGVPDRNGFKAVVLPVKLEEKPSEIEHLETFYQMGVDEKLDYNPIEKYLKVQAQKLKGISLKETARWMGESVPTVKEYLDVMKTMDDYLCYLEYDGIYTQLDGREDQFIHLTKWLKTFHTDNGGKSAKAFDGYKDDDVDDLETIAFDYIRVKYEGKKFRLLGHGQKENHFFGDENIWDGFKEAHFKNITPIRDNEEKIDFDSKNLTATLNARDDQFKEDAETALDENLEKYQQKINDEKHKKQPEKLITRAIDAIEVVEKNSKKNVGEPKVLDKLEDLNKITTSMLQRKSPRRLLQHILNFLSSTDFSGHADEREELLQCIISIKKKANELEKKVKKLK